MNILWSQPSPFKSWSVDEQTIKLNTGKALNLKKIKDTDKKNNDKNDKQYYTVTKNIDEKML